MTNRLRPWLVTIEAARYAGQGRQPGSATYTFDGALLAGSIRSRQAHRHIAAWAAQHRPQLEANWAAMNAGQALERIEPLR